MRLHLHDLAPRLLQLETLGETEDASRRTLQRLSRLAVDRRHLTNAVSFALEDAVRSLELVPLLVEGWTKAKEIQAARARGGTEVVALASHTISVRHEPTIEFLIDGNSIGSIDVNIRIQFALKGVIVNVEAGRIRSVRTAEASASAVLGVGGQDFHTENLGTLQLPGTLTFDAEVAATWPNRGAAVARLNPYTNAFSTASTGTEGQKLPPGSPLRV
jgi:hypothetical protein